MNFERTNTKISLLDDFYNHFKEEDRLKTRHGYVEYNTNMHYIMECLNSYENPSILDLGAGCGAYSHPLIELGYNVTAVELTLNNFKKLNIKKDNLKCYHHDARDLSFLGDEKYDVILLFGPMYHVMNKEDKLLILKNAKEHLKDNGYLFTSYYMNDYAVIAYGVIKGNLMDSVNNGSLDENFCVTSKEDDIFSFDTLDNIDLYNKELGLKRYKIFASDGLSDLIRTPLNKLSKEAFDKYLDYQLSRCEKKEFFGYSSHIVDIVQK